MKLYIKSSSQYNEAFNRIQQSLVLGKKDRQEVMNYLADLYDEDKLTEEEYDELSDKAWNSLAESTSYDNVRADYPLAVTFYDSQFVPRYTIYDVSEDGVVRYALLNVRDKCIEELSESPTNDPNFLYTYVKDILNSIEDLNEISVGYTKDYDPLKR